MANRSPELKKKAATFWDNLHGNKRINLALLLRQENDVFCKKIGYRSLSTKRSNYKSRPLDKMFALPPDYQIGLLKPVTPIKSANDRSIVLKSQGGFLFIPKVKDRVNNQSLLDRSERILKGKNSLLKEKIKALSNRVRELNKQSCLSSMQIMKRKKKKKIIIDSNPNTENSVILSPTQESLLKIWDKLFDKID